MADRAGVLPIRPGTKVLAVGARPEAVAGAGLVPVEHAAQAELAVLRIAAPFEPRGRYFLEPMFHQGSLELQAETIEQIRTLAAGVPVVLVVALDRPAILTPVEPIVGALVAEFGCSDEALLQALTGAVPPRGRLPFDLPRSAGAADAVRPDVPSDTLDPLFRAGTALEITAV